MTPRPSSPSRPRLRPAVLLAAALVLAPALAAIPRGQRPPLAARFHAALFPAEDPGYIPLVGSPPLRFGAERPAPPAVRPPPVVLYAPPPRAAATAAAPATTGAAVTTAAGTTEPPATEAPPSTQVKPEDVLPYFQLDDGSVRNVDALHFTPALPSSRADYRQQ